MGLGIFVEAWSKYGIQMLVLMSLVLQLLLFILPILRRHKMLEKGVYSAKLCKLLLWLAYQLADTTAIYVLGHMAVSSLSGEVTVVWVSVLLAHLGGQDTVTAYSMEDNRLWKRHLLTLLVQAAGVAYVLHGFGGAGEGRSSGPYPRLLAASALTFVAGFLKFAERIWVLWASDVSKLHMSPKYYGKQDRHAMEERYTAPGGQDSSERAEEDLKQAHDLLYFCMCQFVGGKARLFPYHKSVIKCYASEKRLFELVHLQLSLMHDLLYTKAAAIHTWCGCLIRVFSWLATAITCMLVFLSGTGSSTNGVRRLDVRVTYALVAGAFLLETASSLRAAGSTWTYQILRSRGWWCPRFSRACLRVVLAFRRLVRAAEQSRRSCPRYTRSVFGQRILLDTSPVVDAIEEMVTEYMQMDPEETPMNRRGGLSLDRLLLSSSDQVKVTLTQELEQLEFYEYLLLWYHATIELGESIPRHLQINWRNRVDELSSYMMYLLEKKPHMLPPPIRCHKVIDLLDNRTYSVLQKLLPELLGGTTQEREMKFKPLFWVWAELLCYAANNCNLESHIRELSNGLPEFATVLWVIRDALIDSQNEARLPGSDESPVATE